MKKLLIILFVVLFVFYFFSSLMKISPQQQTTTLDAAISATSTPSPTSTQNTSIPSSQQVVKVTQVIDGDTIQIETGQKVRLIGIDSPEVVDSRKTIECFGKEASLKTKELLEGKFVRLEKDVSEVDRYGRLLRYIYKGDVLINKQLVSDGYAHANSYPPDTKYQNILRLAEQDARENNRGLWNKCPLPTISFPL